MRLRRLRRAGFDLVLMDLTDTLQWLVVPTLTLRFATSRSLVYRLNHVLLAVLYLMLLACPLMHLTTEFITAIMATALRNRTA